MGQARQGQGLQPDSAGAGQGGEEEAVAAEDHVLDAGDAGDLEGDAALKCSDVAGVDAEGFAGGEIFGDDFAGEFEPGGAYATDFLEQEAVSAEDTCAERLLEADA